jgi:hypothetical protein
MEAHAVPQWDCRICGSRQPIYRDGEGHERSLLCAICRRPIGVKVIGPGLENMPLMPDDCELEQSYPNPASSETSIAHWPNCF